MNDEERKRVGYRASWFGLVTNLVLFVLKISLGLILRLFSIVTDSLNNLSDFGNNLLSLIGVKAANKPADEGHPYGHQRVDYVISLFIGVIIVGLGLVMLYQGVLDTIGFIRTITSTGKPPLSDFSYRMYVTSLSLLAVAVLIKVSQSLVYFKSGKKISSLQLKALGKDALNDVLSTALVIVGMVITWLTGYDVDCFFTITVAVLVIVSGIGVLKDAVNILIGQRPSEDSIQEIVKIVKQHSEVLGMHDLRVHYYGNLIYASLHLEMDGQMTVEKSHKICDSIEKEVYSQLSIHMTTHVDPVEMEDKAAKTYANLVREAMNVCQLNLKFHDFHHQLIDDVHVLEFDVVLPDSMKKEKEKVRKEIETYIQEESHSKVKVYIGFDDIHSDFLAKTGVEK